MAMQFEYQANLMLEVVAAVASLLGSLLLLSLFYGEGRALGGWSWGGGVYEAVPRFPGVTRDIAMLVPLALGHAEVVRVLESVKEPLLVGVELFDVFADASGEKVPADRKSLAYSLTYRSVDRTLTTEEVNAAHGRLKEALAGQLAVSFRE